jgi:hypothetical protein
MFNTQTQSQPISQTSNFSNSSTETQHKQTTLTDENPNIPFGDLISSTKDPSSIRIFYRNVNGILRGKSWHLFEKLAQEIKTHKIDICGLTETNINWNTRTTSHAKQLLQKQCKPCSIYNSSHNDTSLSLYQPGGTLTAITGNSTGRIIKRIEDQSGMGRWSGYQLSTTLGPNLNIITVYQPTVSDGINTSYQQQYHTLKIRGNNNPNPRKILLQDLTTLIQKYNKTKQQNNSNDRRQRQPLVNHITNHTIPIQHINDITNTKPTSPPANPHQRFQMY